MRKKTVLFLMVLFSGVFWAHIASAAPQIHASIYDASTIDPSYPCDPNNPDSCTYDIAIIVEYTLSYTANQGGLWVYALGRDTGVYAGNWTSNGGAGWAAGTGTLSSIQDIEQDMMSYGMYVAGNFTNPDGSTTFVQSNIAQITNPLDAPIGSPLTSSPVWGDFSQAALTPYNLVPHTSDPINIATGEDYFSSTDFALRSRGPKLELFRRYRSFSTFSGMFGYGWRTDYDANLTTDSSGDVTIYDRDGTGSYFMNNSGIYTPSPGNYSTIVHNADNTYTVTDKYGVATHYDINGRLTTRTDRNGNTLTFVYNPAVPGGTYIQDASGRQIKLYFNSNNLITSAVDPAGKTFQYGYDVNGNLASITDPTGAVTNYTYNSSHQITQFTNANSHSTYYQYDSQGRAISTYQSNNVNKTTLNYEANNTTVVTDSLGNNSTYVFNNYALLLSKTDPTGAVTEKTWDPNMNLLSLTDPLNNTTNSGYDMNGNLIQIVDPLGKQTNMTYTPNYNLISTKTDALGDATSFSYDGAGNLTGITDALGGTHSFVYDGYGNVITATDSLGNSTNFTYDAIGHLIQKTDALGDNTFFTYE